MNWEYVQPVRIRFGKGMSRKLADVAGELGYKKGFLVSDSFFIQNGLAEKLASDSRGVIVGIYGDVSPNPETKEVDACAAQIRASGADFVIALGGGSALDCAKSASVMALCGDSIVKYHNTGVAVPKEHLPIVAIPTTSGTGSEVTCVSVLSNHEAGIKGPIVSESFYPVLALIDPELTYTTPKRVTASCGIDVLCHAVEGFWSKGHQPICDALALHAAKLVFEYLERAYENPLDEEAREKMSEASVIAGLAFTLPKTTASHACSFPLTNLYRIPHGEACGLTLDYFCRINRPTENYRLDGFCRELGFADADAMADEIAALKRRLGLRTDLREFDLTDEDKHALAAASRHPNLFNNPVDISEEMLYEMYVSLT